ncbi:conserved hypothetical protein [Streptomyces viridochromogenes DSM 40736]|uniref:Uncharacterized protein n=1 Tax=Streptomyces viridochromogenes (strain DSM 40736 / JCM 4977 / BCRC 1201 / Tue 494) TaxID=591159 RepID=D9XHV7_STRVT|nr:hypothetical protein [Streptomyces viridochromogenes]EFL37136.1 conserved hypothetical protein [Streptomyces viridochromogenes DSM 40736]
MPELYSFSAVRSPRRAEPDSDATMPTVWDEGPAEDSRHWGGGSFLEQLIEAAAIGDANERATTAQSLAESYLSNDEQAVNENALAHGLDPYGAFSESGAPLPAQPVLALIGRLDRWLVTCDHRPEADHLDAWLARETRAAIRVDVPPDAPDSEVLAWALEDRQRFAYSFSAAWMRIVDSIAAALLIPTRGELAQRLTRLMLVLGLVERRSALQQPLSPEKTFRLLARRVLLMPDPPFPRVLPEPQVKLVRRACVSDLFVIRQEWRCYVAGEIADIRNVLAHESHLQRLTRVDERENTELSAADVTSVTETSSETSEESSFREETRRQMDLALRADGQVDASGQYGPTKLDVSAGFSADFSLEEATTRATDVTKRAVARAATRIESRTRTERVQRSLTRVTDVARHEIDNTGDEHVRGIYRWVNRVDRFQIWRYPDRLQLEFEIPEPGRFLLTQLSRPQDDQGTVPQPPDRFELPLEGITPDNYLQLAAKFGATGLPEPMEASIGVSQSFTIRSPEPLPSNSTTLWNANSIGERQELAIPAGYAATQVIVKIDATPIHGWWRREYSSSVGWEDLERFHTITGSVAVGDQLFFVQQPGPDAANTNTIQSTGTSSSHPQYLDAHLHHTTPVSALTPPVSVKLPIAATLTGAASGTVTVEATCAVTEQARAAWRQDVYDGLRTAYDLWVREWRAEQARSGKAIGALAERSPVRHDEMIRAELRRHVVSWLLGESPFQGRPAVRVQPSSADTTDDITPDIDIAAALATAPEIQFLEQCLEWSNLSWVCYPYYWADRDRWARLSDLETVDPQLGQFLRSGSARVVVPVRPGFSAAVKHWLLYRQPWLGASCAPVPDNPLYVSIAQEIRDQLMPPADGIPGESWEVALPTSLQWLDSGSDLPANAMARLGAAPHEPTVKICPDGG